MSAVALGDWHSESTNEVASKPGQSDTRELSSQLILLRQPPSVLEQQPSQAAVLVIQNGLGVECANRRTWKKISTAEFSSAGLSMGEAW